MFNLFKSGSQGFEDMTVRAYHSDYVKGNQPHTLVDVRTPAEFRQAHVPGAINIPLDKLANRTGEVPTDKPVIVICASGNRSRTGAAIFNRAGFTNVYNVQGGIMSWMSQGFATNR